MNVRVCHCRLCQKSMAGPFFARALFASEAITFEGRIERFASSERLDRLFCPACGTRIGTARKDGSAAGLALALFDDRNAFAPSDHIWTSEKQDWLIVSDGLPQYDGMPPA